MNVPTIKTVHTSLSLLKLSKLYIPIIVPTIKAVMQTYHEFNLESRHAYLSLFRLSKPFHSVNQGLVLVASSPGLLSWMRYKRCSDLD